MLFRIHIGGHANVIKFDKRPFKDVQEMDEAMVRNWNSVVKHDDTVYHLGDFAFLTEQKVCNLLSRLNGRKIFIFGNHDKVMRSQEVRKYFELMTPYLEVNHNGNMICMMHYPMARWNKSHRDAFHIYGHEHGSYNPPIECRMMDVGAPCINYTPIRLDEVIQRLSKFPSTPHH